MAVTENWGTAGTAGVLGWTFPAGIISIGTTGGSTFLGISHDGSARLPNTYVYDGNGSYAAHVYYTVGQGHTLGVYIKTAEYSGGTNLWLYTGRTHTLFYDRMHLNWYEQCGATWTEVGGTYVASGNVGWQEATWRYSGTEFTGTVPNPAGGFLTISYAKSAPLSMVPNLRTDSNSTSSMLDYLTLPFSRITILDFIGTYNNGSSVGTYNLGNDVLTMGGVSQVGYIPYLNAGFSSTIPVTIDNTGSAWSGLVGNMSNPTFLAGTYIIRHYWNSTWTTLSTCYAEAEDITYDYGKKIASVTLHDMLSRKAEQVLPMTGAGDSSDLVAQWGGPLGTVIATDTDKNLFTIRNAAFPAVISYTDDYGFWFQTGDILWDGTGSTGNHTKIGSAHNIDAYGAGTWYKTGAGTFHGTIGLTGTVPSWIAADAVLYSTARWPTRSQLSPSSSTYISKPHKWFTEVLDAWGGMSLAAGEAQYIDYYNLDWGKRYYPGDKFKTVLNDLCAATLTSYAIDGDGDIAFYTDGPWTQEIVGTIDFNTGYNKSWTISHISSTKQITIESNWDEESGKYLYDYRTDEGTYDSGRTMKLSIPWLRDSVSIESLADRIAFQREKMRDALSFQVEGSLWTTYIPRSVYLLTNLPAAIQTAATRWRLMGKTYSLKEDLTMLTFENIRADVDWFTIDKSTIDGEDRIW